MLYNSSSGLEIGILGRILTWKTQNRHSGRPAGRSADFEAFPARTRPKSGPEAQCEARKHYCVTWGRIVDFLGRAGLQPPGNPSGKVGFPGW